MTDPTDGGLLQARDLWVRRSDPAGGPARELLRGVDLTIGAGESVALVGPSGSGKSLTARALLGLLPPGFDCTGEVSWRGQALGSPDSPAWRRVRGRGLGLILQEPLAALNPVQRVGDQIAETLQVHRGLDRNPARAAAVALLAEMRVPDPELAARRYAHQLSGGMRQRVLLAAALACDPALLIADEPTTALDVAVQKEILALISRVRRDRGMALLFITHDLDLVPLLAERVAIMDAGRITSVKPAADIALPVPPTPAPGGPLPEPVLTARGLSLHFRGGARPAVGGVDLDLWPGQAVGLLGESGSGKSTVGRLLARHLQPDSGTITLDGRAVPGRRGAAARAARRRVQMLFQDPGGSLDPRQRLGEALREAAGRDGPAPAVLLAEVGLAGELADRYPHQMSGGQRQRAALARCLAPAPDVLIADEPTSALDAASRDLVLALLGRIMAQRGLALLLITHDFDVARRLCREVHLMCGGLIVETIPAGEGLGPVHPHGRELLRSLPRTLREQPELWLAPAGPNPVQRLSGGTGCPYNGGCPLQKPICGKELPPLKTLSNGRRLRCPEAETGGSSHFIDTL